MVYMSQPLGVLLLVLMQLGDFPKQGQSFGTSIDDFREEYEVFNQSDEYESTGETSTDLGDDTQNNNYETSELSPTNSSDYPRNYKNVTNPCESTWKSISEKKCYRYDSKTCENLSLDLTARWNLVCNEECPLHTNLTEQPPGNSSIIKEISVLTYQDNNVLMVTSCPPNYENGVIKQHCESIQTDLLHDIWLMAPVSDSTGKTYKNVFCAACNESPLREINFWQLLLLSFETETGEQFSRGDEKRNHESNFTRMYARKIGFWKYNFEDTPVEDLFCCFHNTTKGVYPEENHYHKNVGLTSRNSNSFGCGCLKMKGPPPLMPNNTNNTFGKNYSSESSGNFILEPEPLSRDCLRSSRILKLSDKNVRRPGFSKCNDQLRLQNEILYDILCTNKWVDCTKSMVKTINKFDDPICADCQLKGKDSNKHTWVTFIYTFFLFVLRTAIVGLIIHELIFLWLPAKSTLDKNLGGLGFTLLIQNLCALYDNQKKKISCGIVTSIWHYSMLSSFTWVLILSYDCWLSLRQLFQLYEQIGEYDQMQFFIYFAISQIIPLLVTSAALTFGSSPLDSYSQQDLSLDRYECLLSEVPGFILFFLIPATFLFALNIYFLVRIGCLVFPRQLHLKKVRQKFKERSGFALMMSPTWLLGSLLILTHFMLPVCDILIFIVHILQTFFFLVYAFNHWLDRIMQKYEEIERNIFGETVYCPMSTSVLDTQDRQLLEILDGRQSEQCANQNLYS